MPRSLPSSTAFLPTKPRARRLTRPYLRPALLRLVVDTYGDDQILVGSDYPFYPAKLVDPFGDFAAAGLSASAIAKITNDNPRRFLGLA